MTILQPVALAVRDQVGDTRHRPVVVHDLADDAGRRRGPRGARGRPRPRSAPSAGGRRRCAPGAGRRAPAGRGRAALEAGVDRDLDRAGAVVRRDPGRDAFAGLDRDRERGAERRLVLVRHLAQAELVAALRREAEADQPAAVRGHEVDRLRRDELRGDREVALVLAVVVVDDDDEAARADLLDRLLDAWRTATCSVVTGVIGHRTESLAGARPLQSRREQALDVLGEHVHLEVDLRCPGSSSREGRLGERVRDQRDAEAVVVELRDGERDALDRDRALLDAVAERARRAPRRSRAGPLPRPRPTATRADAVDVALDDVPAERARRRGARARG